jgi:hypothetical protein
MLVSFSVTQASINTEDLYYFFFTNIGRILIFIFSALMTCVVYFFGGDLGVIDSNEIFFESIEILILWIVCLMSCVLYLVFYTHFGNFGGYRSDWSRVCCNRIFRLNENEYELEVINNGKEKKYKLTRIKVEVRFDRAIFIMKDRIFVLSKFEIDEGKFSEFVEKIAELSKQNNKL